MYHTSIDSIVYRYSSLDICNGVVTKFRFPPLDVGDFYLEEAIEGVKFYANSFVSDKELYGVEFCFNKQLIFGENYHIDIDYYAKSVKEVKILLTVDSVEYPIVLANNTIAKNKQYYRLSFSVNSILKQIRKKYDLKIDSLYVKKLSVYSPFSDEEQKIDIGDLVIYKNIKLLRSSYDDIIYEIMKNMQVSNIRAGIYDKVDKTEKYLSLFENNNIELHKYPIQKEIDEKSLNLPKSNEEIYNEIISELKEIVTKYKCLNPFLNDDLLSDFDDIVKCSTSLDVFYEKLNALLIKVNDPHLRLIDSKYAETIKKIAPIHFYSINEQIKVVAILDTTLKELSLGDRLERVNGLAIEDFLDKSEPNIYASSKETRRRKAIQYLLNYSIVSTDTLRLNFSKLDKRNYSIVLTKRQVLNNANLKIPGNIQEKMVDYGYKDINGIGYLNITKFQSQSLRPFWYSIVDSLMATDALILDLRNNKGGDLSSAFLFSFLIENPDIFFTYQSYNKSYETLVVKPDAFYNYMNPVLILIDSRTACSAEFLINALQHARKDIYVFGCSKTAGTAQAGLKLKLPETDSNQYTLIYRNANNLNAFGQVIDNVGGILPDVWVNIKSYIDLAPYEDIALKMACEFGQKKFGKSAEIYSSHVSRFVLYSCPLLLILPIILVLKRRKNK